MFLVGSYSTFAGASKVETTKVKLVEKFGPHPKRANRWLDAHPPKEIDGDKYRSIVFVLPRNFRLSNDMVQAAIKRFKCDWQTAKFHVYREHLVDVIGNKADWLEFFPKEEEKKAPEAIDCGAAMPPVPEPEAVAT